MSHFQSGSLRFEVGDRNWIQADRGDEAQDQDQGCGCKDAVLFLLVAYNEWVILQMIYTDDSERQCSLTQLVFKYGMSKVVILEPKPPHDKIRGYFFLDW